MTNGWIIMNQALTVDSRQRFKIILESLSHQLICEKLPHRNGKFDLCIGPKQTDNTHCGNVKNKKVYMNH